MNGLIANAIEIGSLAVTHYLISVSIKTFYLARTRATSIQSVVFFMLRQRVLEPSPRKNLLLPAVLTKRWLEK